MGECKEGLSFGAVDVGKGSRSFVRGALHPVAVLIFPLSTMSSKAPH